MSVQQSGQEALSQENRRFEPPPDFTAQANVQAEDYERAARDRLGFWEEQARRLQWEQEWSSPLDWQPPIAK